MLTGGEEEGMTMVLLSCVAGMMAVLRGFGGRRDESLFGRGVRWELREGGKDAKDASCGVV